MSDRGEYEIVDLINQVEFKNILIRNVFDLGSEKGIVSFREKIKNI